MDDLLQELGLQSASAELSTFQNQYSHDAAAIAAAIGKALFRASPSKCIGPEDAGFAGKVEYSWSATCHLAPRCIFLPANSSEVGQLLRVIRFTKCPFVCRSGGHNPNRGWASIDDRGILLDLSNLNHLRISDDKKSISIGPGLKWYDVYRALDGSGVTVLGGRTPDVGVGGLVLGGGIPNFSSEYGLVCDRVEEFQVVLADSRVIQAGANTNKDLFWALKGGGPNFGVVTSIKLRTIPIDKVWYEARIYEPIQNESILKAVYEFSRAAEKDPKASFALSIGNQGTFVGWVYSEPLEKPRAFEMFYDIPFTKNFTEPTIGWQGQLNASMARVLGPVVKQRRAIVGLSVRPNLKLYQRAYSLWKEVADKLYSDTKASMTFGIQVLTSSAVSKGQGQNALGISPEPQSWLTSVVQYTGIQHDQSAHAAVQKVAGSIRQMAKSEGLLLDFVFMNDANWEENPIASYGPKNITRLKAISNEYDPEQMFQTLQPDGFLLRKL